MKLLGLLPVLNGKKKKLINNMNQFVSCITHYDHMNSKYLCYNYSLFKHIYGADVAMGTKCLGADLSRADLTRGRFD